MKKAEYDKRKHVTVTEAASILGYSRANITLKIGNGQLDHKHDVGPDGRRSNIRVTKAGLRAVAKKFDRELIFDDVKPAKKAAKKTTKKATVRRTAVKKTTARKKPVMKTAVKKTARRATAKPRATTKRVVNKMARRARK